MRAGTLDKEAYSNTQAEQRNVDGEDRGGNQGEDQFRILSVVEVVQHVHFPGEVEEEDHTLAGSNAAALRHAASSAFREMTVLQDFREGNSILHDFAHHYEAMDRMIPFYQKHHDPLQ